jgi:hypothetical protein
MADTKQKVISNGKSSKEPVLLLKVDQIKYRKPGPGKSPMGTFCIYEDHVEWTNNTDQVDQLLIHFSKIKGFNLNGSC